VSTVRSGAQRQPAPAEEERADRPSATGAVAAPSRAPLTPTERGRTLAAYLLATLGGLVGGLWSQRVTSADLRVPFAYWGDAVAVSAHVKTTLETGWYERQPLLGAPAGQTYHDFPTSDNLHLAIMRVLGGVLGDWAATLNIYFLLGFPLAALAAMVFLRAVGLGRTSAVAMSVLYALAPYHYMRGEGHLWLASYYPVPLALLLVLRVVRGQSLWRVDRSGVRRLLTSPAMLTVVTAVLVASAAAYYAVFTMVLLGVSGLVSLVHRRSWRAFVGAAAAGALFLAAMLANMLPDILWEREHGSIAGALVRLPGDAEVYALKISSLLLPTPDHVIPTLAEFRAEYDHRYPVPSEQPALGLVGAVGLLVLLGVAVLRLLRSTTSLLAATPRRTALAELAALTVLALLFATVGGLSSLISFVSPEIRGWNRMSIFIALLCLGAVGLVLDSIGQALNRRRGGLGHAVVAASAVVLVVGGAYDQTAPRWQPDHVSTKIQFDRDARFVAAVEDELGAGAMVAQLPYMSFPEAPAVNGVFDTDQLRMYLHSATLRWSGGGIKGRASSDWLGAVDTSDVPATSTVLAAARFDGVVLDRLALGEDADVHSTAWRDVVGEPAVVSEDGRYELYPLGDLRQRLVDRYGEETTDAAGNAVVQPTFASPAVPDGAASTATGWAVTKPGPVDFVIDNARDTEATVRISFALPEATSDHRVVWPDGSTTVEAGPTVTRELAVPAGRSTLSVEAPSEGDVVAVSDLTVALADRPSIEPLER
jgi:hypothetical protein